jgi:hypothetical protein
MVPVRLFGGNAGLLTVPLDSKLCHVGAQNAFVVLFKIYRWHSSLHTYMIKGKVHLYRRLEVMRYSALSCGQNTLFLLGKQQEPIDRYHRRRGVCRSCRDQWCVEVPWNDLVCRNIIQKVVRHTSRCIQVAHQPCTTVHFSRGFRGVALTRMYSVTYYWRSHKYPMLDRGSKYSSWSSPVLCLAK